MTTAYATPRFFSLLLALVSGRLMNRLGIARADVIKASLARSSSKIEDFDSFDEAWLIIALPHVRERTIIKAVGKKLERIVILERPDGLATQVEIGDERLSTTVVGLKRDWIAVWLLMLMNYSPKRLFILASIDDFCFMPLKAHLFKENIAFDSQDPMGEYAADAFRKQLAIWNYKFGVRYIVRDPRFKGSLRRSRNRKAAICYMPDAPIFETIGKTEVQRKFRDVEKIRFVSSGWVSAEGDEGVLRTFRLIRALWPNSEIHLCLTQMMSRESPVFAPLVKFVEGCGDGFVHENLRGEAYRAVVQNSHVGIALHDPAVFGEPYEILRPALVRRCPSARVLDYAVSGCILMTTNMHRFSQHIFKLNSPHKKILNLSDKTGSDALMRLIEEITNPPNV
jgi:hypothetical protein